MYTVYEVYNNVSYDPKVKTDFGYSCFIEEPGVLFDAGSKGDILLGNLEKLEIPVDRIRHLVLSHDHWDHRGGADAVLDENPNIKCYYPPETSPETISILEKGADCIMVTDWLEISRGVFISGPVEGSYSGDKIFEQSIVLDIGKGYFLITGCSHPHISKIAGHVRSKGKISGIIGGFHDVDDADISSFEGIEYLAPSHCTTAIDEISASFPDKFHRSGAGYIHRI